SNNKGADVGFLTLLGEAGYQYQQRKNSTDIQFTALSFNAQRGELVIELRAKNFEQMDQLKTAIVSAGLIAKISSAVQENQYYRGRLSVSEG
ncbi:GspL/Epsl periplasmic domain-containing protein, partial [Oleiphilus sp. HI0125]